MAAMVEPEVGEREAREREASKSEAKRGKAWQSQASHCEKWSRLVLRLAGASRLVTKGPALIFATHSKNKPRPLVVKEPRRRPDAVAPFFGRLVLF